MSVLPRRSGHGQVFARCCWLPGSKRRLQSPCSLQPSPTPPLQLPITARRAFPRQKFPEVISTCYLWPREMYSCAAGFLQHSPAQRPAFLPQQIPADLVWAREASYQGLQWQHRAARLPSALRGVSCSGCSPPRVLETLSLCVLTCTTERSG